MAAITDNYRANSRYGASFHCLHFSSFPYRFIFSDEADVSEMVNRGQNANVEWTRQNKFSLRSIKRNSHRNATVKRIIRSAFQTRKSRGEPRTISDCLTGRSPVCQPIADSQHPKSAVNNGFKSGRRSHNLRCLTSIFLACLSRYLTISVFFFIFL